MWGWCTLPREGTCTDDRTRTCNHRFWRPAHFQLCYVRSMKLLGQKERDQPFWLAPCGGAVCCCYDSTPAGADVKFLDQGWLTA